MTTLLRVDSSALSQGSHSKELADYFLSKWQSQHHDADIQTVDLAATPPPHMDQAMIGAMYTMPNERDDAQKSALALSEQYVAQIRAADTLVLTSPMYNFAIPSTLKAYLDHILRVGETFQYGENGPEGLLKGKKAYVFLASGGDYTQPPMDALNFVKPYLKTALNFIGIEDITFIEAPGMGMGDDAVTQSIEAAKARIDSLL